MPNREKVIDCFQAALRMKNEHGFCILPFETVEDALELLKAQEPRVLTFEEVLNTDHDVFCEFRYGMEVSRHSSEIVKRWAIDAKCKYGQTWRCWTSRPTDEQREAVKWE